LSLSETGKTGIWIDFENIRIAWYDLLKTEKIKSPHFFNLIEKIIGNRIDVSSIKIFFSEKDLLDIIKLIHNKYDPIWKRYEIITQYKRINPSLTLATANSVS